MGLKRNFSLIEKPATYLGLEVHELALLLTVCFLISLAGAILMGIVGFLLGFISIPIGAILMNKYKEGKPPGYTLRKIYSAIRKLTRKTYYT